MKNIINIILVALLILFTKSSIAQNTGVAYIENPQVNGLVFSWELHFERTNDWTPGLLSNALGSSTASFNFNTLGLTNPSLVIEPGGPLDNANYPNVTVQIINDECIVDIPFVLNTLAGILPLNVKTKLLTVSMDITNTTLNAGLSWDEINTGFFDNSDATIVTTLTGGSNIPLPVELTSLDVLTKFVLYQNYPNPFNPVTTIQYSLSTASDVKLTVFNILGEKVSTLVNEYKEAGSYSSNFDASLLNSGIYFYKLEGAGNSQVRKMSLLK